MVGCVQLSKVSYEFSQKKTPIKLVVNSSHKNKQNTQEGNMKDE
jgi:hypothetical protein